MVRLGDICTIQSGGTPSRSNFDYWKDGTISWVKISDIKGKYLNFTEEHITSEGLKNSSAKIFSKGTILYTIFATLGEVSILNIEAATNQAIAGIKLINDNVYNDFLYYYLVSKKEEVNKIGRGVAQNNINLSILKNFEIRIPELQEQRKIVNSLNVINEIINKRKQQLKKLDEFVKSRFIEMFGESQTNSKSWGNVRLEEIANIGSSKRVFVNELKKEGIPFYRGTEVGALAEGHKIKPELYITKEHYKMLIEATGVPMKGDLLMPSICSDGRIWLVDTEEAFYFKDGRVLWIHPESNKINSCYLKYVLKDKIMKDYINIASGTTFAELKIFTLKSLHIILPPLNLQNQFATFVEQTNKSKLEIQKSLDKLEILKKSLMQQYFG